MGLEAMNAGTIASATAEPTTPAAMARTRPSMKSCPKNVLAARAERRREGDLAFLLEAAREKEVRPIDARDQEKERYRAGKGEDQSPHASLNVAEQQVSKRNQGDAPAGVRSRVLRRDLLRNRDELGLRLREGRAVLEASHHHVRVGREIVDG